ncbi:MAG: LytTR family transcriptional regulator DNA-binding domain-containing protein [Firmicutes bacterium]|nr:LytTR family transcriptional regulator DNA-binding domain-containing protein [Bacillota bacterium]
MDKYIPFVTRQKCCKISLEEVLYIEQIGREVMIVTEKTTYRQYGKITQLQQYLDESFFNCLKTMIINFSNVVSMQDQTVKFKDGTEIFLGRQNFVRTKQTFAVFIKKACNSNGFVV